MNICKFSVALCMLIIATSCSKEIDIDVPGTGNYITVRSKVATKAGYTSQSLPSEFVMDIIQGETGYNYSNVIMSADPATGTYKAMSSQGNTIALKWANSNHSSAQIKAMTIPSGVATTLDDYLVEINVDTDQSIEANFKKNDILGASINDGGITIKGDDIEVAFNHLMSKLHVVYETANKEQSVEYIKLKNVCTKGYYSYAPMKGGQPTNTRNDIKMFLNPNVKYGTMAAEAIFYPYAPTSASRPQLVVKLVGGQEKSYNISIPNGFSFGEGKRYLMSITINSDGSITNNNKVSEEYDWVKNVPGGKILWVGTSIPAGGGTVFSYPQMISNATGLEVVNNSVGGSLVLKNSNGPASAANHTKEEWDAYNDVITYSKHLVYGGLVQTFQEVEAYREALSRVMDKNGNVVDASWVEKHIIKLRELSYISLIIPYIDGTKDNCSTIVIDHGFNDRGNIMAEAGAFNGWDPFDDIDDAYQWADVYFDALINGKKVDDTNGIPTYDHYKAHLSYFWNNPENVLTEDHSYIIAMDKIISACREINPDIRIIIGNYFTEDNLWINFNDDLYAAGFTATKFAKTICNYNRAVASIFNCDIVNVCDFLGVANADLWSQKFEYKADGSVGAVVDNSKFCPDGVHPSSDETGKSNRAIADIYLQELSRIFANSTRTKSSSHAEIYDWEDVELL